MGMTTVAIYAAVANRVRHQLMMAIAAATPFYPTLAMRVPSNSDLENYDWLGQVPGVREWLGDRVFKQLSSYDFSIKNRDWEQSILLPKKHIDDGRTGYFGNLSALLAEQAAYHPDELLIELMNAAGSIRCFDGQHFFDTDHEMGDSGVQSNLKTREVVDSADPTEEEIRNIVFNSLDDFYGFKGDNGKPLMRPTVEPINDLLLAVPAAWHSRTLKAFNAKMKVDGGAAVDNYLVVQPRIVALQGLNNTIDVYRTGQTLKPFVFQDRERLQTQTKGLEDIEFKDIKIMTSARYNVGVLAWWLAIRNTLTNA